jgi:uncharacterized membrane protein SpoIIM required for sporulation/uncharacterized RDD family membrane protein YckC
MAAPEGERRSRQVRIFTAERVPLVVPAAGLGERAIAAIVDAVVLLLWVIAALFLYTFLGRSDLEEDFSNATHWTYAIVVGGFFAAVVFYDVVGDVIFDGRTLGKRLVGLRVIDAMGRPPDLLTSVLRNVLRLVDLLPLGYGVGAVTLFWTGNKRLGDLVADTIVIHEQHETPSLFFEVSNACGSLVVPPPAWSDADVARAVDFVWRSRGLAAGPTEALCARVLASLPVVGGSPALARARLAAGVVALSARGGLAAQLAALDAAERDVRLALASFFDVRAVPWTTTRDRLALLPIDAGDAVDTAARAAAAALLQGTRRQVPLRWLQPLSLMLLAVERLRRPPRGSKLARLRTFFGHDVPLAVFQERENIGRVAVIFSVAAAFGFALGWLDGDAARALMGDDLASAVDGGANWTNAIEQTGSYVQTSVEVIFNNVGVGLRVFALGIFGGVASMLGVAHNGITLGAVMGYATQLHTEGTLARFLIAHAPVELTMMCVAGAAGLCLGRAIVRPGHRSRLAALRQEGAQGLRLVSFASVGFLVIGTVEGFVSPGQHFPWLVNASVGVLLWLLFLAWVLSASHAARR